jgi:DNA modification methylase
VQPIKYGQHFTVTLLFYLRTWSSCALSPNSTRKRNTERSDSIRSMDFRKDHEFNVRWLRAARRILKPDGTLWVRGTHHIIFSLGFVLQRLGFSDHQLCGVAETRSPS